MARLQRAFFTPGAVDRDQLPTDQLPTDQLPTDQLPTDQLPTDQLPTDQLPPARQKRAFFGLIFWDFLDFF